MAVVFGSLLVIVLSISHYQKSKRIKRDPHVRAEIMELWVIQTRHGYDSNAVGGYIKFTRSDAKTSYSCEVSAVLGDKDDGLKVGELIEVVPRLDSCYEPIVVPLFEKQ